MRLKLLLCAATCLLVALRASAQDTLPEGRGQQQVLKVCAQCHEAQKAASLKLSRAGWSDEIDKMKALGATASDQDFSEILEYLVSNFRGEIDRPLDMNSADSIELESVIGLLRRESAAVLQYRAKRGPFRSLTDLKDLDPVILKKIETKKDRVVFLEPAKKK